MNSVALTLEQVRVRGLRELARELGPVGMVRFLQQFEQGAGDYGRDRDAWLTESTVDELLAKSRFAHQG